MKLEVSSLGRSTRWPERSAKRGLILVDEVGKIKEIEKSCCIMKGGRGEGRKDRGGSRETEVCV